MTHSASISVYRSNRMERLVDELTRVVRVPLSDPLQAELCVVQGRGMALWLNQELARHLGVSAHADFCYPKHFVERVLTTTLGATLSEFTTSPDALLWPIWSELEQLRQRPEFERVSQYLENDSSGTAQLELCRRIAQVFDQYLTYRPQLIQGWEDELSAEKSRSKSRKQAGQLSLFSKPSHEVWQKLLWQRVSARIQGRHLARLEQDLVRSLSLGKGIASPLPERISVFGIASLPPAYVRILAALAPHSAIHLFLLSPCQEYWADLHVSNFGGPTPAELGTAVPSSGQLLASLGMQGAEFNRVLTRELELASVFEREPAQSLYQVPPESSLLSALQTDLLELRATPSRLLHPDLPDDSLRFHACHSPFREVEVLHDQLLALLTSGSDVAPENIIVMMPDVDTYAPLVEAVFLRPRRETPRIPFRIVDRSLRHEGETIDAFVRLLDLAGGRLSAAAVLDLLTLAPVHKKFGLSPEQVEQVSEWVIESSIRWGVDALHRQNFEQPAELANTWRFGLRRLLLGYAMSDSTQLFSDTLPLGQVEGNGAQVLGRLADFCERLFTSLAELDSPRSVRSWQECLSRMSQDFLESDEAAAWQERWIRDALEGIAADAARVEFEHPLSFAAIRLLLQDKLSAPLPGHGFLSGGVTFSALVPMRSIPFKVVCLLGMGESQFPRSDKTTDFDLTAPENGERMLGDRTRRGDDRYLFLETLLSSRGKLLITYTGQSIRDNSAIPPSVVVSELIDHIALRYAPADTDARLRFKSALTVRHPLQAFSTRYFDGKDAELFSYEQSYLRGASSYLESLRGPDAGNRQPSPFFAAALERPPLAELDIAELLRFVNRPIAYLFQRRLNINLSEATLDVPEREPCEVSALEQYWLGDTVLNLCLEGRSEAEILKLARASGNLPPRNLGVPVFDDILSRVRGIESSVREAGYATPSTSMRLRLELTGGRVIVGELNYRAPNRLLRYRYGKLDARQLLQAFVLHLVGCSVINGFETTNIGRDEDDVALIRFPWLPNSAEILADFVRLYEVGLNEPVPLFPEASLAYVQALKKKGDSRLALAAANKEWETMLARDPHLLRVYGHNQLALDGPEHSARATFGFSELAMRVFSPLVDACH